MLHVEVGEGQVGRHDETTHGRDRLVRRADGADLPAAGVALVLAVAEVGREVPDLPVGEPVEGGDVDRVRSHVSILSS